MPHKYQREGEATTFRMLSILSLVTLSISLVAFLIVHTLVLMGVFMNTFASLISEIVIVSVLIAGTSLVLWRDIRVRLDDSQEKLTAYVGMQLMPEYRWSISTWGASTALLWSAAIVIMCTFFADYTTGVTLPQPAFQPSDPELNWDYTTGQGQFNVRFFASNMMLFVICALMSSVTFYFFLVYSLQAYVPIDGQQIQRFFGSQGVAIERSKTG